MSNITFPVLRSLMAKYGINYAKLGEIIPNKDTGKPLTYQTISTRINTQFNFDLREMMLIRDFFNTLIEAEEKKTGKKIPRVTVNEIFFDWLDSNEDIDWNLHTA